MKNLLFLLLSSFLLITISCQKQELEIPETKYQKLVYEIPEDAFGEDKGIQPSCTCNLNVKANRDNTGLGLTEDWTVKARIKAPGSINYQTFAQFGGTSPNAVLYSSSATFPDASSTESITFDVPSSAGAQLIFNIPYTGSYPDFADTHLRASITCLKANQFQPLAGVWHATTPVSSGTKTINGRITRCSAYSSDGSGNAGGM